ncbi:GNAT family N-acetyltransferase [Leekyejoonella antrihumi]|uniref:GNAT family N-acetyltransferase n=2 Tax=Leekyejoonella antrihumi TaxID=1660198 RepID=A0A563E765_9MICO|nr:GNAT family N-acetyltransferase [Leekyejoonella antrihumi]
MDAFLQTERLLLRQFTSSDAGRLVQLDADPRVMRFITGGPPEFSAHEVESEVLPAYLDYYRRGSRYGFWAVDERRTGEFVGWFHLRPAPDAPEDRPELGYRLRQASWGRGYATEGSRALIDKGFTELGVERIEASTMVINTASRRVMEKAGMRLIRRFVADWPVAIPGDEHGDVEYAITRQEWAAAESGPLKNVDSPKEDSNADPEPSHHR